MEERLWVSFVRFFLKNQMRIYLFVFCCVQLRRKGRFIVFVLIALPCVHRCLANVDCFFNFQKNSMRFQVQTQPCCVFNSFSSNLQCHLLSYYWLFYLSKKVWIFEVFLNKGVAPPLVWCGVISCLLIFFYNFFYLSIYFVLFYFMLVRFECVIWVLDT